MTRQEFILLSDRVASGIATDQEINLYLQVLGSFEKNTDWDTTLMGNQQQTEEELRLRIYAQLRPTGKTKVLNLHKFPFLRVAVAVIVFVIAGWYLFLVNKEPKAVLTRSANTGPQQVIMPGSNKATLVLGDESIIELDTAANGLLTKQGGSEVIKTDNGEIIYRSFSGDQPNIFYQKLITPRGGQYQITLPDGSQVWLNAESSIRFPNVFNGDTRSVEITGEVYFEVKSNKLKPFIVKTISDQIMVMGTRFNINAYADEPSSKISLINGSIKVNNQLLQPGEAMVNNHVVSTNTDQDIAWIRGAFDFNEMDLAAAFRQLSRWYNVDIVNVSEAPKKKLGGKMGRDLNLSQVLVILSKHGVKTKLEGNKLTILSE